MMGSTRLTLTNCFSLTKFCFFTFESEKFSLVCGKFSFNEQALLEELCPYNPFLIFLE